MEILLRITNLGSAALIVSNLRLDVRYTDENMEHLSKESWLFREPRDDTFGSLRFPKSLTKDDLGFAQEILVGKKGEVLDYKGRYFGIDCKRRVVVDDTGAGPGETTAPKRGANVRNGAQRGGRGIPIVSYDTVVQPRVSQVYIFITALPSSASYVLVYSSFRYGVHPRYLERLTLRIARAMGFIQYSLYHVTQPHTAQRVFSLRAPSTTAA